MEPTENTMTKNRPFAVTGVEHGDFVYARCKEDAVDTFRDFYDGEEVLHVRDCENEPFKVTED